MMKVAIECAVQLACAGNDRPAERRPWEQTAEPGSASEPAPELRKRQGAPSKAEGQWRSTEDRRTLNARYAGGRALWLYPKVGTAIAAVLRHGLRRSADAGSAAWRVDLTPVLSLSVV